MGCTHVEHHVPKISALGRRWKVASMAMSGPTCCPFNKCPLVANASGRYLWPEHGGWGEVRVCAPLPDVTYSVHSRLWLC